MHGTGAIALVGLLCLAAAPGEEDLSFADAAPAEATDAQVLAAQGNTGPFDPAAVLVQDPSEIVDSVIVEFTSGTGERLLREALVETLEHVKASVAVRGWAEPGR